MESEKLKYKPEIRKILADTVTPVSIYLRLRSLYPKAILLESSDYHGHENAWSYICFSPAASFIVDEGEVTIQLPGREKENFMLTENRKLHDELNDFYNLFDVETEGEELPANGLFGYINYDAVQHFESIKFSTPKSEGYHIPEVRYSFYRYVVAIDHHTNQLFMIENLMEGETSQLDYIHNLLINLNFSNGNFEILGDEKVDLKTFAKIIILGFEEQEIGVIHMSIDQVNIGDIARVKRRNIKDKYINENNDEI